MFGSSNIVALGESEMDELVQAVIYTSEGNSIIAHHDRPYTDNIIKWLDKHFLSFIDYYRCAVYGLSKDMPPVPPRKLAPFVNRERIPKGKAVILSPFAKSVVELPSGFWRKRLPTIRRRVMPSTRTSPEMNSLLMVRCRFRYQ